MPEKCSNSNRVQAFGKPSNVLKAIETKAINIRKLLQKMKKPLGQGALREMNDAVRLSRSIEAIALHAQNLTAADAIVSVELLELMLEELDKKLTRILAF